MSVEVWRRARRAGLAALAVLMACALAPAAPAAPRRTHHRAPVNPRDRVATAAYISAYLTLEQSVNAAIPNRIAASRATAAQLAAECPGILAHAPDYARFGPGGSNETGRQSGEFNLRSHQLERLRDELLTSLAPASTAAEQDALAIFIAAAKPLSWSSSSVTRGVANFLAILEQVRSSQVSLHVCADMASWVASGYRVLSPATKAVPNPLALVVPTGTVVSPSAASLRPYEGALQRTQLREVRALRIKRAVLQRPLLEIDEHAEAALGFNGGEPEGNRLGEPRPLKGSVVLGRGRTATGASFVVRYEPPTKTEDCELTITGGAFANDSIDGGSPRCSFRGRGANPRVNCASGRLTIEANLSPATRRVRLRLSDGHTITSQAILIPARYGGPAGFYYQVVRGPSPIPVSLTELSASGLLVRVTRLPAIHGCTQNPLRFLPGGIRTVASGKVPGGGPRFSIRAERFRFLGQVHLHFRVQIHEQGAFSEGLTGGFSVSVRSKLSAAFPYEEESGCAPHPWDIVFGLLEDAHDSVLAHTSAGPVALHAVRLPASLHAHGMFVYGVFSPPASAVTVRGPRGVPLGSEPLHTRELIERCEGETEPSSP